MTVIPLASSSKGNAYAIIDRDGVVFIDCGISLRRLRQCCAAHGIDINSAKAVLITHDHSDHVSGLGALLDKFDLPVYTNYLTACKIASDFDIPQDAFVCFENGQNFEIGNLRITPFSTPHDAADSVGYLIESDDVNYFHATDLGTALDSIGTYLADADIATLESNHDRVMLETSNREMFLKRRIAGPRGHLSNDDAAELVKRFATPRLKRLFLAHLSEDCNSPSLAESAMRDALKATGMDDIELKALPAIALEAQ